MQWWLISLRNALLKERLKLFGFQAILFFVGIWTKLFQTFVNTSLTITTLVTCNWAIIPEDTGFFLLRHKSLIWIPTSSLIKNLIIGASLHVIEVVKCFTNLILDWLWSCDVEVVSWSLKFLLIACQLALIHALALWTEILFLQLRLAFVDVLKGLSHWAGSRIARRYWQLIVFRADQVLSWIQKLLVCFWWVTLRRFSWGITERIASLQFSLRKR